MDAVGIRSLAVCFPDTIRTNEYWQDKDISGASLNVPKRVRIKRPRKFSPGTDGIDIWSRAVRLLSFLPYVSSLCLKFPDAASAN